MCVCVCLCVFSLSLSLLVFQVCIIATKRHDFPTARKTRNPYVRLVQTTSAGQAPPRESLNNGLCRSFSGPCGNDCRWKSYPIDVY